MAEVKIIDTRPESLRDYLLRIYQYRALLITLIKREFFTRYIRSWLGAGWAILYPLMMMGVYVLFFRNVSILGNLPEKYELHVYIGILCWSLLSNMIISASSALWSNAELIEKLDFPKIILVISKGIIVLTDTIIGLSIAVIFYFLLYGQVSAELLLLPLPFIVIFLNGLVVAIGLSAVTIENRDIYHLASFVMRFGIWFTPVFYSLEMVPASYRQWLFLNPVVASLEIARSILIGSISNWPIYWWISPVVVVCLLAPAMVLFKNLEPRIAEKI